VYFACNKDAYRHPADPCWQAIARVPTEYAFGEYAFEASALGKSKLEKFLVNNTGINHVCLKRCF